MTGEQRHRKFLWHKPLNRLCVLCGKKLRWRKQRRLKATVRCTHGCERCNYGFSRSDISFQQAIHGNIALKIFHNLKRRAALCFCELKRKRCYKGFQDFDIKWNPWGALRFKLAPCQELRKLVQKKFVKLQPTSSDVERLFPAWKMQLL